MNVLKPHLQATITTLLEKGVSQREISRKTGVDRKTVRKYEPSHQRLSTQADQDSKSPALAPVATGFDVQTGQNPPPRPPASDENPHKHCQAQSACEIHRDWIERQVKLGRNAVAIYQDLVEQYAFTHKYNSVKRFVRKLKKTDPRQYDRLECLMGQEAQVDYGQGALTLHAKGKYRRPRLFIMTLKYSARAFRKVVWKSSKETWARLHEEAFRYFGGCCQYVTLDNLKEGVIKPDIYDPGLNGVYACLLGYYGVTADPARVGDPNRKGTVENAVKHTQDTALKGRRFESLEAQNDWLRHWEQRWAARRVHGRAKRRVEEMFQEERPYLMALPLSPFRYFQPEKRSVYDDGTIQVGNCYYAAGPATVGSEVQVRIYDTQIEILDPGRMEVIRRHPKGTRPGSLMMEPTDRIFNPSRETDRLLARAERIGPHTFSLCEKWFNKEGRSGQRRMYGLLNLVRHYPACYVEKAAELARIHDLTSCRAVRRMVEAMAAQAEAKKAEEPAKLTQEHALIRPGQAYAAFWDQHTAQRSVSEKPPAPHSQSCGQPVISSRQLAEIWGHASWLRVIEIFSLTVDPKRRGRNDEIWLKSPFTQEDNASMHVSLSQNIYKDFSSGKGGGIMQFCRDMLRLQGRPMTMFEVAAWMLSEGISTVGHLQAQSDSQRQSTPAFSSAKQTNRAITIDLRRYLRPDHPELHRRGISAATCRYLGCGFLPPRTDPKVGSPLNGRIVFQIRGISEHGHRLESVILSHIGRAISPAQEESDGKYWSYPFRKGLEIYNQDHLLLDEQARQQTAQRGLVLVEGFFDVAKLVEAGCRNVMALMGSTIADEQIQRLLWIRARIAFDCILLFLDRDQAGAAGAQKVYQRLRRHDLKVAVFDWNQSVLWPDGQKGLIAASIRDPAEMSVNQLRCLGSQGLI